MRDLNLGPDTQRLVERFNQLDKDQRTNAQKADELYMSALTMARMLERWNTVGWCWTDACPAQICSGPHVKVRYSGDAISNRFKTVEVIEPYNKVGETFPDVPFTIIR